MSDPRLRTREQAPVVETVDVDAPADYLRKRSFTELTEAVFGRSLSAAQVAREIGWVGHRSVRNGDAARDMAHQERRRPRTQSLRPRQWIGSVGYERFKSNRVFATTLRQAGVRCLVDVREIAISRRDGYSKSQLSAALAAEGIEYLHMPRLGNPKEFRDLYKAGNESEGKARYEEFLLAERRSELRTLASAIAAKRSALMCVEHDYRVCHRKVILDALRTELGLNLRIAKIS